MAVRGEFVARNRSWIPFAALNCCQWGCSIVNLNGQQFLEMCNNCPSKIDIWLTLRSDPCSLPCTFSESWVAWAWEKVTGAFSAQCPWRIPFLHLGDARDERDAPGKCSLQLLQLLLDQFWVLRVPSEHSIICGGTWLTHHKIGKTLGLTSQAVTQNFQTSSEREAKNPFGSTQLLIGSIRSFRRLRPSWRLVGEERPDQLPARSIFGRNSLTHRKTGKTLGLTSQAVTQNFQTSSERETKNPFGSTLLLIGSSRSFRRLRPSWRLVGEERPDQLPARSIFGRNSLTHRKTGKTLGLTSQAVTQNFQTSSERETKNPSGSTQLLIGSSRSFRRLRPSWRLVGEERPDQLPARSIFGRTSLTHRKTGKTLGLTSQAVTQNFQTSSSERETKNPSGSTQLLIGSIRSFRRLRPSWRLVGEERPDQLPARSIFGRNSLTHRKTGKTLGLTSQAVTQNFQTSSSERETKNRSGSTQLLIGSSRSFRRLRPSWRPDQLPARSIFGRTSLTHPKTGKTLGLTSHAVTQNFQTSSSEWETKNHSGSTQLLILGCNTKKKSPNGTTCRILQDPFGLLWDSSLELSWAFL